VIGGVTGVGLLTLPGPELVPGLFIPYRAKEESIVF